jgi:hypothetical protein
MRFNARFTQGTDSMMRADGHIPAINHARPAFIENKRCRAKPRGFGDVVNPKTVSVYQTDAVLILIGGVQRRFNRALADKQL